MSPNDAIEKLDEMQSQIIHGSRIFGEIADLIRNSEKVRRAALFHVGLVIEKAEYGIAAMDQLSAAHRILANNQPA